MLRKLSTPKLSKYFKRKIRDERDANSSSNDDENQSVKKQALSTETSSVNASDSTSVYRSVLAENKPDEPQFQNMDNTSEDGSTNTTTSSSTSAVAQNQAITLASEKEIISTLHLASLSNNSSIDSIDDNVRRKTNLR